MSSILVNDTTFSCAKPVWPRGRREKMNDFVLFRTYFAATIETKVYLRITASTYFRARLNGEFLAHGPMRGPKGFFRIQLLPLAVKNGGNTLEIEVSGANVNSFDYMDQPSFLQAEVVAGNKIIAATGKDFAAFDLSAERIQKVSRLCYQRLFFEAYRVTPIRHELPALELETCPDVSYLPSRLPEPKYRIDRSFRAIKTIRRTYADLPENSDNRAVMMVGKKGFKGFPPEDLDINAFVEIARYRRDDRGEIVSTLYRGRINNAGFIKVHVNCHRPGRLVVLYDELESPDGGVNALRLDMTGALFFDLLEPGEYDLESLEPTALKFAEVFMHGGEAEVIDFSLREYKSPFKLTPPPKVLDADLKKIYRAGTECFADNAVDVLTDCPTRERAGWLCDSFFTARAAFALTGSTLPEKCFLENFLLAPPCVGIPDAVFPMAYPGDHPTGQFIPNWGMWLLPQLEEYARRSGDKEMIASFKNKVFAFIDYIDTFLNPDGLLENLPNWVFVEWSRANDFVQDVNYPSNMLYTQALDAAAALYNVKALKDRAEMMRKTILQQSFDGKFFRDHAIRQSDGSLTIPADYTEVCQYYAFYFGVATFESHSALWNRLVRDFGPRRNSDKMWKQVFPANAFMGDYLRLELLIRAGEGKQALKDIKDYFLKMAKLTGTLWEHNSPSASCCHGFPCFIDYLILKIVGD